MRRASVQPCSFVQGIKFFNMMDVSTCQHRLGQCIPCMPMHLLTIRHKTDLKDLKGIYLAGERSVEDVTYLFGKQRCQGVKF